MAHFAELDDNNVVLRVIVVSNNDVTDLSTESEEYVAKLVGSGTWKQTSYSHSFRGKYAAIGDTYDVGKNAFIAPQPYASWSLDANDDWEAPVPNPTITTYDGDKRYTIGWDEDNQRWTAKDEGVWNNSTNSYDTEPQDFNWDASELAWVSA